MHERVRNKNQVDTNVGLLSTMPQGFYSNNIQVREYETMNWACPISADVSHP